MCVAKINQGGGVAAPIAAQVLGEVLPYLEVVKKEQEEVGMVTVPDIIGMSLTEVKKVLKDVGLEYDIKGSSEEYDVQNVTVVNQLPKKGITVKAGTKMIIYIN